MESSWTRGQTHVPWIGRFSQWATRKVCLLFLNRQDSSFLTSEFQRAEQLLIKGGAALKPPEARLKGQMRLIKIRRLDHLRPWTHPSLVSSPTLLKLCRRKKNSRLFSSVAQRCPILFESQVSVWVSRLLLLFKKYILIYGCTGSSLLHAGFL